MSKYQLDGLTRLQVKNSALPPNKSISRRAEGPDETQGFWNWKKISLIIIGSIIIILVAIFFFLLKVPLDQKAQAKNFEIKKGQGAREIAAGLKQDNLIRSSSIFLIYVLVTGKSAKLNEGIYELSGKMNISEIVGQISLKKPEEIKITIIEGWRIEEIATELEKNNLCSEENFIEALSLPWTNEFDFLADRPRDAGLEGYLFPDTYFFGPKTSAEEIVRKMLKNFDQKINPEMRNEIKKQNKTIFEALTMASIIEREAKNNEDRPKIASVYYNRLKNNLKLEADPTVQYAKGSWQPLISGDYERIDSLYNTYLHLGLPPGPICSPGLESIKAAIYPAETNYLYFFHLKDGTTIYSITAEEHEAKKKEYKINGER